MEDDEDNTMKNVWKVFKTVRFIATGYMNFVPVNPDFLNANRKAFHEHLLKVEGVDAGSKSWLTHLQRVNYYCDQKEVKMLEEEMKDLIKLYNDRTKTSVHVALNIEKGIFGKAANKFEKDTWNYDLRKFRPAPCFLPDGEIKFTRKD